MEKFIENLEKAQKTISSIDHMIYVSFPLIKDKRILLKVLKETKNAIANCISSILQYDYLYKRIKLYKSPEENFRVFREKSALRYLINQDEINLIVELFKIVDKHNESSMEFFKDGKVVILSDDLNPETVSYEKTKQFLVLGKSILEKAKRGILK